MAVPKYHEMMQPVLAILSDGNARTNKELQESVAQHFNLNAEDRGDRIKSGVARYVNNVSWACVYLKQAGLIESADKRGTYRITDAGMQLLAKNVQSLNTNDLMAYPGFVAFIHRQNKEQKSNHKTKSTQGTTFPISAATPQSTEQNLEDKSPEETIDESLQQIRDKLADDLLAAIMQQTPDFFESLVVRLLCAMGYGDMQSDAGVVTKKTGDEGIDGIVREDKLGFDKIYVQAKRWDLNSSVGRPELQKFVGALTGIGADKGLFITTAQFSEQAKTYAHQQHAAKLVLVDGQTLAGLMIDNNVGVSVRTTYEVKSLDRDFFED